MHPDTSKRLNLELVVMQKDRRIRELEDEVFRLRSQLQAADSGDIFAHLPTVVKP